ncbi:DUF1127 domain-containing protein [Rhodobacteraceae bacterium W635]|uniref:DUF1127 domain-containing protein n=1 Tax=Nioella halotolerans TaxID=2303578 RepID=UPI000E3D4C68|nr:DUF1127 domain-containing protein [Rhodobacteraceae bacterium W635]
MAYASHNSTAPLSLVARFTEILDQARESYAAWRVYRKTCAELSSLSARDLDDLGIGRGEIRRIAMDAAYGQAR